jgi:hypothetical protein
MSGLEIAGLVLGAFPIVCGAARELEGVFQNAVSWWEFETSFENLITGIRTQEIAYQQVLERLVEHLDVSEDEYNSLVGDQDSPLWSEPWIKDKVEKRFHERHIVGSTRTLTSCANQLQNFSSFCRLWTR